jgi:MFS family permease
MKLHSSLRALNYYNFRLYFFGQAISLIGTWMQRIAVSWLVYELTHSAFMLGLTGFVGQIPMLVLSPYAGAYVDRHSRYRTLLATQIASMIQAGLLALLVMTNHYTIASIIALSFLLGVINTFDMPSRQSLMIILVQNKKDLPNAIALNSSMVTLARLAGPAVAGILLSGFGEGICFFINFLSFLAVLVSLLLMKLKIPDRVKNIEPIWKNLREGFVYIRHHRGISSAIALMALSSLIVMPYSNLFPVYAQSVFKGNVSTFAWLNSISGLGALFGAIYMATRKRDARFLRLIILSSILLTISLMLFSYTHNLPIALFIIMVGESGMLIQIASTNTYIQTSVEEHMRGRVIGYYAMAFQGIQPIGILLTGWMAHVTSAPLTVFLEGIIGLIVSILFIPALRRVRRKESANRLSA